MNQKMDSEKTLNTIKHIMDKTQPLDVLFIAVYDDNRLTSDQIKALQKDKAFKDMSYFKSIVATGQFLTKLKFVTIVLSEVSQHLISSIFKSKKQEKTNGS